MILVVNCSLSLRACLQRQRRNAIFKGQGRCLRTRTSVGHSSCATFGIRSALHLHSDLDESTTMATLLTLLDGAGDENRTALVVAETGTKYSYQALRALVLSFRDVLRTQLGVGTGDVVATNYVNGARDSLAPDVPDRVVH